MGTMVIVFRRKISPRIVLTIVKYGCKIMIVDASSSGLSIFLSPRHCASDGLLINAHSGMFFRRDLLVALPKLRTPVGIEWGANLASSPGHIVLAGRLFS
jgi:hypothetical protein